MIFHPRIMVKFGKNNKTFYLLPAIRIKWVTLCGDHHYFIQFAWLWWYFGGEGDIDTIVNRELDRL